MKLNKTKELTLSAMMTALIVILGLFPGIPLGFIPVPLALQSLGVMMAGELLGSKYGTYSVVTFLLLVALGLPFLSGGRGGAITFVGPTGGYLIGWLVAPAAIGWGIKIFNANHKPWWGELFVMIGFGVILIDLLGALWLTIQSSMSLMAALTANLVFIPGDVIKTIISVIVSRRLRNIILK